MGLVDLAILGPLLEAQRENKQTPAKRVNIKLTSFSATKKISLTSWRVIGPGYIVPVEQLF